MARGGMDPPDGAPTARSRRWGRIAAIVAAILVGLVVLAGAGLWALTETAAGRGFVARQIAGVAPKSGLRFEVARIDGSLLSEFSLHDIRVRDLDGVFATIPVATVRWQPLSLIGRHISLDHAHVPRARLLRMWRLNPPDPNEPLLPDINIHLGELRVGRLEVAEPVAGIAARLSLLGTIEIDDGRLLVDVQAAASAGDRLTLVVDAQPDANRFALKVDARAPAGGLVMRLAGLPSGMTVQASGAGRWDRWRGRLLADMLPADGRAARAPAPAPAAHLADIAILGDGGQFRLRGDVAPAPLLPAAAARLVAPAVLFDATVARTGDRLALRFSGRSDALGLEGQGGLDMKANRLVDVRAEVRVRRATLIDPRLAADGLVAEFRGDGPLRDPALSWTLAARALRWQEPPPRPGSPAPAAPGVDMLAAAGSVTMAEGRPLAVPVKATAARLVGLPPELTALLARPAVEAVVTLADDGAIAVDGLVLRSTLLVARGGGRMTPDGGIAADVTADAARLDVPALGRVSAAITARAVMPAGRPLTADGRFSARALALTQAGVRDFLGGLPTVEGRFRVAPDGVIQVDAARLDSPALRFAGARGSYDPATGVFTLAADGTSTAYGPVSLAASGTIAAPRARISLAEPGFGLGLRTVVADIAPDEQGFAIRARGESPQGPLDVDVLLAVGDGEPMVLDVRRATFGGIAASGRLVETAAGPFSGRLDLLGRGLRAQAGFAADGVHQRIDVDATMRNARLPLDPVLTVAQGRVQLALILVPGTPVIAGTATLAGARAGDLALDTAGGRFDLKGETGTARIAAAGRISDGDPFRLDAAITASAGSYRLGIDGMIGDRPVRLDQPAQIDHGPSGWRLRPVRLLIAGGRVDLAGTWGERREVRLAVDHVDLGILDYGGADLGLGGAISGQAVVRLEPGAPLPLGEANLRIEGLSRSGLTGLSVPVDMEIDLRSSGDGMTAAARARWRGNTLGRLVLGIRPGPGADMAARFAAARLTGGIRYNGPVEPLWALVAPEGHDLAGPVAIAADFAGTPAAPQLSGLVHADGLAYRGMQYGTTLSAIRLDGRFEGPSFRLTALEARAGSGTVHADGEAVLSAGAAGRVRLAVRFDQARLADNDLIGATVSGPLTLDGALDALTLSGDLKVDNARGRIVQMQTAEIPVLKVRRAGVVAQPPPTSELLESITLAVALRADDRIRVEGMGLDSVWRANVRVTGRASAPQIFGRATLQEGEFTFASSVFKITSGTLTFNGPPLESALNIQADTTAQDITATIAITGTAAHPQISFSSTPSLPQDEILSRLLFGASVADLSVTEAVQLASAVAGLQSGVDTMSKIRRGIGLDRLRLVGQDAATGMGSGLAIGKRLNRNLYAEVLTDSQGNTLTTVQWTLSRLWSLIAEVSSLGHSSLNASYRKEY